LVSQDRRHLFVTPCTTVTTVSITIIALTITTAKPITTSSPLSHRQHNHHIHQNKKPLSQALMLMFRITFNKLFEWFFSRMLANNHGGPGLILGRDMSVSGPLRMKMTLVKFTTNKNNHCHHFQENHHHHHHNNL
jgi:hypothetical protein